MFSLFSKSEGKKGKGLWKHNNSLCEESTYISIKKDIISTLENIKNENITNVWKYLKYEIRKFSTDFSKVAVCSR